MASIALPFDPHPSRFRTSNFPPHFSSAKPIQPVNVQARRSRSSATSIVEFYPHFLRLFSIFYARAITRSFLMHCCGKGRKRPEPGPCYRGTIEKEWKTCAVLGTVTVPARHTWWRETLPGNGKHGVLGIKEV